ncbi:hypothetical protein DM860_011312 [Cuscuta australis]|uniref:Oleosin n=1 Tax=Cuscuta australis TaxID=267555 RepID=A0A328DPN2_9ASTE|nr:hypothetical protein DM860_011312 [Cuscuta australis]
MAENTLRGSSEGYAADAMNTVKDYMGMNNNSPPTKDPTTQQIIAVAALFPIGAALLGLSGLTFAGTIIGIAVATPLFVLFSPVIVPAALAVALAVTGVVASGAFGITALSSLYWLAEYARRMRGPARERVEHGRWRVQEHLGGQKISS